MRTPPGLEGDRYAPPPVGQPFSGLRAVRLARVSTPQNQEISWDGGVRSLGAGGRAGVHSAQSQEICRSNRVSGLESLADGVAVG